MSIAGFFAAADVFSGQDLDSINNAVTIIEELRHRRDADAGDFRDTTDVYISLDTGLALLLPTWTDMGGTAVAGLYDDMRIWYEHRKEKLFVVSKRLVEFAAVIEASRRNINDLMGKLVKALEEHTNEGPWDDATLRLLDKIVGFALGKLDPTGVSPMIAAELFGLAIGAAEEEKAEAGLTGDTYYDILGSYMKAARDVCESAARTSDKLAVKNSLGVPALTQLRTGMPPPPALP
jgi:hypothetical protein